MKSASFFLVNFDYLPYDSNLSKPIPTITPDKIDTEALHQKIYFTDLPILNTHFSLHFQGLEPYFQKITQLYINKDLYWRNEINLNITKVLLKIFRHLHYESHNNNDLVAQITTYIQDHFSENISNQQIAKTFGYHPNYLNRLFVEHTGMSMHKYLLNYRMDYAIRLFETTNMSAIDIAYSVGFQSLSYFSRIFKKYIGYNFNLYKH